MSGNAYSFYKLIIVASLSKMLPDIYIGTKDQARQNRNGEAKRVKKICTYNIKMGPDILKIL